MDTTTARKRLEQTRDELDRSIMVLQGDRPLEERSASRFGIEANSGELGGVGQARSA